MKAMFLKELKLNVKIPAIMLCLLGGLCAVPNYPMIVSVGYCVMQVFLYMQFVRENLSQEFSTMLPVKRSDIVSTTTLVIVFLQSLTITVAAICATMVRFLYPVGNLVGIDPNFAFFGIALLCLGVFNSVFIVKYYKTGYKFGLPIVFGLIAMLSVYLVIETLIQAVPALKNSLDTYDGAYMWARLVLLGVGIAAYCILTAAATKVAIKKFEKVNL